jgi:hypothetical protein
MIWPDRVGKYMRPRSTHDRHHSERDRTKDASQFALEAAAVHAEVDGQQNVRTLRFIDTRGERERRGRGNDQLDNVDAIGSLTGLRSHERSSTMSGDPCLQPLELVEFWETKQFFHHHPVAGLGSGAKDVEGISSLGRVDIGESGQEGAIDVVVLI